MIGDKQLIPKILYYYNFKFNIFIKKAGEVFIHASSAFFVSNLLF
ncbi:hypothetical protein M23134_04292 [Microscilla marina ATCC 23134]|uniref:Uncharacterized protein n=1 Tax=Microscilla marina ATCC 23134 TaxID=313606 RepID=A1ZEF1_MICM2|nr:hypothetical protein M23134_04292 [Microscilla marina ATCC 23134]